MALDAFGFLFTGRGLDPDRDRSVIERDGFRAVMVGMADPARAPEVAARLVDEGIQLIELCGGLRARLDGQGHRSHRIPGPGRLGRLRAGVDRRHGGALPAQGGLNPRRTRPGAA
jgi:hypothetical protein